MRRILLPVLAVIALIAVVLAAFRGPLSQRVMARVLERNLSTDFIAELPDGLHVALCGAGGPLPDPQRSGPCVAVVAGTQLFVVDAGSGGSRNMAPMGLPPGRVDALLLTHFHSDHIDGLGEMALQRWAGGARSEPLPVFGPTGVVAVVNGFNRAYAADAVYRVAHHGEETVPPSGRGMTARPFATPTDAGPVIVWEADGLRITAFRVDHAPVDPAVGYRFDYGGRSVLLSGDTSKSAELERNAAGVDLLVHEALAPQLVRIMHDAAVAAGVENIAKITADIPDYHATPVEAAQIAQAVGAGHLLYYHIVPPLPAPGLESVWLEGVSEAYSGRFTVGVDGTFVSLPSGSDAIDVSSR